MRAKSNVIIYLNKSDFLKYKVNITDVLRDNPLKHKQMCVKFIKVYDLIETYVKFINLTSIELSILTEWIEISPYSPMLENYIVYDN